MARADILKKLYSKKISPLDFHFDSLMAYPLLSYITIQDIQALNKIATSLRLSSKPKLKYQKMDEILNPLGFKRMTSGTNRAVYKYLEDQSIVLKVALDKVGMSDNPNEYQNQMLLKPFCCKVFEVSPCGTVALVERVNPITHRDEFKQIASDVFDLITEKIIGKYVLEDIGIKFFMNYGIRDGFGPVLLDFPYVYELDGAKLVCNNYDPVSNTICGGTIDYDAGFNFLHCEKCGKQYLAQQLQKDIENNFVFVEKGENHKMAIVIKRGNEVVKEINQAAEANTAPIKRHHEGKLVVNKPKEKKVDVQVELDKIGENNKSYEKDIETENTTPVASAPQVQEKNENISATNYGGNLNDKVFSKKDDVKEEEEKDMNDKKEEVVYTTDDDSDTTIGNLIPHLNLDDSKEDNVEVTEESEEIDDSMVEMEDGDEYDAEEDGYYADKISL